MYNFRLCMFGMRKHFHFSLKSTRYLFSGLQCSYHKGCAFNSRNWSHSANRKYCNTLLIKSSSFNDWYQTRQFSSAPQGPVFNFLSESKPVITLQESLVHFHDLTGLPWWTTIILSSAILRSAITFPLAVYQNYIIAKYENVMKEMVEIVKELNKETALAIKKFGWTDKQAKAVFRRSVKIQRTKLVLRDNCHPFKGTLLILFQIPLWVCYSAALRNLVYALPHSDISAYQISTELSAGGCLWFQNLLIADSTMILPIMFVLANLTVIEISALTRMNQSSKLQRFFTNLFRVISLGMGYVSTQVPSCLVLYWLTSSVIGVGQNLILLSPRVRNLFSIPVTPSTLSNPYKHIVHGFQAKVERILRIKPNSHSS